MNEKPIKLKLFEPGVKESKRLVFFSAENPSGNSGDSSPNLRELVGETIEGGIENREEELNRRMAKVEEIIRRAGRHDDTARENIVEAIRRHIDSDRELGREQFNQFSDNLNQRIDAILESRERINAKIAEINGKFDRLNEIYQRRLDAGMIMHITGRHARQYKNLFEEIVTDYARLQGLLENNNQFEREQKIVDRRLAFFTGVTKDLAGEGFLREIGRGLTTKQGLGESAVFLGHYFAGVARGAVAIIDPRTWVALVQLIGAGAAFALFGEDRLETTKAAIRAAGGAWDKAGPNERANILGQIGGGFVGVGGVGVAARAGMAARAAGSGGRAAAAASTARAGAGVGRVPFRRPPATPAGATETAARTAETGQRATEAGRRTAEAATRTAERSRRATETGRRGADSRGPSRARRQQLERDNLNRESTRLAGERRSLEGRPRDRRATERIREIDNRRADIDGRVRRLESSMRGSEGGGAARSSAETFQSAERGRRAAETGRRATETGRRTAETGREASLRLSRSQRRVLRRRERLRGELATRSNRLKEVTTQISRYTRELNERARIAREFRGQAGRGGRITYDRATDTYTVTRQMGGGEVMARHFRPVRELQRRIRDLTREQSGLQRGIDRIARQESRLARSPEYRLAEANRNAQMYRREISRLERDLRTVRQGRDPYPGNARGADWNLRSVKRNIGRQLRDARAALQTAERTAALQRAQTLTARISNLPAQARVQVDRVAKNIIGAIQRVGRNERLNIIKNRIEVFWKSETVRSLRPQMRNTAIAGVLAGILLARGREALLDDDEQDNLETFITGLDSEIEVPDFTETIPEREGTAEIAEQNPETGLETAKDYIENLDDEQKGKIIRKIEELREKNRENVYTAYDAVHAIFGDEFRGATANREKRREIWEEIDGNENRYTGSREQNERIRDYLLNLLGIEGGEDAQERLPVADGRGGTEQVEESDSMHERLVRAAELAGENVKFTDIFPTKGGALEFHENGRLKEGEIIIPGRGRQEGRFNENGQLIRGIEVWNVEGRGESEGFSRISNGVFENGNLVEGEIKWSNGLEVRGRFNNRGILEEGILISPEGDVHTGRFGERQQIVEGVIERRGGEKEEVGDRPRLAVNDAENILRGLA